MPELSAIEVNDIGLTSAVGRWEQEKGGALTVNHPAIKAAIDRASLQAPLAGNQTKYQEEWVNIEYASNDGEMSLSPALARRIIPLGEEMLAQVQLFAQVLMKKPNGGSALYTKATVEEKLFSNDFQEVINQALEATYIAVLNKVIAEAGMIQNIGVINNNNLQERARLFASSYRHLIPRLNEYLAAQRKPLADYLVLKFLERFADDLSYQGKPRLTDPIVQAQIKALLPKTTAIPGLSFVQTGRKEYIRYQGTHYSAHDKETWLDQVGKTSSLELLEAVPLPVNVVDYIGAASANAELTVRTPSFGDKGPIVAQQYIKAVVKQHFKEQQQNPAQKTSGNSGSSSSTESKADRQQSTSSEGTPAASPNQPPKFRVLYYQLLTAEESYHPLMRMVSDHGQTKSIHAIVGGAHLYNKDKVLDKSLSFLLPVNLSVNGFGRGDYARFRAGELTDAEVMTDLAIMQLLAPKQESTQRAMQCYKYFLEHRLNPKNPALDAVTKKEIAQAKKQFILVLQSVIASPNVGGSQKPPLQKAALKLFRDGDYNNPKYGMLMQSLLGALMRKRMIGCKSGNERTGSVEGRIQAIKDTSKENPNSTVVISWNKALEDFRHGRINAAGLSHALDRLYDRHGPNAGVSLQLSKGDNGSAPKGEWRRKWTNSLNTSNFESPEVSTLQRGKAGANQNHKWAKTVDERIFSQLGQNTPAAYKPIIKPYKPNYTTDRLNIVFAGALVLFGATSVLGIGVLLKPECSFLMQEIFNGIAQVGEEYGVSFELQEGTIPEQYLAFMFVALCLLASPALAEASMLLWGRGKAVTNFVAAEWADLTSKNPSSQP